MAKKAPRKKAAAKKTTKKTTAQQATPTKDRATTEKPLMPTVTDRAKFFQGKEKYRRDQLGWTQEQMAKKAK